MNREQKRKMVRRAIKGEIEALSKHLTKVSKALHNVVDDIITQAEKETKDFTKPDEFKLCIRLYLIDDWLNKRIIDATAKSITNINEFCQEYPNNKHEV